VSDVMLVCDESEPNPERVPEDFIEKQGAKK
jgi:hypothetical protein